MDVSVNPLSSRRRARPASRALRRADRRRASHSSPAAAQAQALPKNAGLPIIRDAEIEQLLREYTNPILRAANLGKQNIQVVLIDGQVVQRLRRRRAGAFSSMSAR